MERNPAQPTPHLAVFDGLRGLAILMVIATHVNAVTNGGTKLRYLLGSGMYGVQTFYVVSAATLMLASARRESLDVGSFAIRRLARIVPLFYLGMVFYLAVPVMFDQLHHPIGVALNVVLVHAFVPVYQSSIVPGGWSIGCEAAFYAAFPLIFRFVNTWQRALALVAFTWLIDAALVFVAKARGWELESTVGLYRHPVFQLPAFATGVAVYHLTKGRAPAEGRRRTAYHALSLAGLSGVIALFILFNHRAWALPPVSLCVGALVYGCFMAPPQPLVSKFMVRLGLISYSMYIWHFAVLFGLVTRLPLKGIVLLGTTPTVVAPRTAIAAFGITLLISWPISELSRRWIELPGMDFGRRIIERIRDSRRLASGASEA